jgi:hypothetical protein
MYSVVSIFNLPAAVAAPLAAFADLYFSVPRPLRRLRWSRSVWPRICAHGHIHFQPLRFECSFVRIRLIIVRLIFAWPILGRSYVIPCLTLEA